MIPTIIKADIGPMPTGLFDPMPKVTATFSDGTTKELFEFYPDEISFTEGEFIGLTLGEARQLKHGRDVDYIQS